MIYGPWGSLRTSCYQAIRLFPATVERTAAGIVAKIAKDAKSYYLSQFVKVCLMNTWSMIIKKIYDFFSSKGRFSFPENEWRDVSDDAKDLINHLLVKEASKRLSAEAVLDHPWIRAAADENCDNDKRRRALKTPGIIRR